MAEPFPTYDQLFEGWKQMQAERDRLRAALGRIGEQASEGVFTEHGECPATFACSAIIAELIDLGMTPKGVVLETESHDG